MLQINCSFKSTACFLFLVILVSTSCQREQDLIGNPPPTSGTPSIPNDALKVTATVTGSVIDEFKKPVTNTTVTAGTYTTSTDAMGNFTFRNINISAANGHVSVTKAGYFKGIRSFVTEAGKTNFVKIQLIKQTLTATITSAAGGAVTANGAMITFLANAFVTPNGIAYTGNVKIYATWIDPTAPNLPLVVPGDLRGINSNNAEYLLKSYGMVGVELRDDNGNTLKMNPAKPATINFPIPVALQVNAPASIPLWHFDEATARWKEEGSATKSGNSYTAQVNEFSFWNVDVPGNFINLDMRLINSANSLPLANTMVKITSLTTNMVAYDFTNDSGYVSGYVPKSETLKLEVIAGTACNTNTVVHTQNAGPYTTNTSLGNVSVTIPVNLSITFTGAIKSCNNLPVTNGYISLSLADGTSTIAYTNAIGVINFSIIHCGGNNIAYSYNAVDHNTGTYNNTTNGTASSNNVNLNTISACGNSLNMNGVYIAGSIDGRAVFWKDGVVTFLTGVPTNPNRYAYAEKIMVSNNDVYVLGVENDSTVNGYVSTIKLWKNGVLTNITNGTTYAEGFGLDVYNGDVYICGIEMVGTSNDMGKIWKNGVASNLPKASFDFTEPSGIKVVNGDVFVSGSARNSILNESRALYWKNGVINLLSNGGNEETCATRGIFINNGDVYVAGTKYSNIQPKPQGVYWKNGIVTALTISPTYSFSEPKSIFVDNNDVYIVGYQLENQPNYLLNAAYWKNNFPNFLTNYMANTFAGELHGIFVKNNIVYTVGYTENYNNGVITPLYFQNNIPLLLSGYNNSQAVIASDIFVK